MSRGGATLDNTKWITIATFSHPYTSITRKNIVHADEQECKKKKKVDYDFISDVNESSTLSTLPNNYKHYVFKNVLIANPSHIFSQSYTIIINYQTLFTKYIKEQRSSEVYSGTCYLP